MTILHHAAWKENAEAVKILLEHRADVNIKDNNGWYQLYRMIIYC